MINQLKLLWNYFSKKRKVQIYFLFFLLILNSIAELISIGAVIPFLSAITNPEILFEHKLMFNFNQFFQINSAEDLLFPITIMFIIAIIFSSSLRVMLLWLKTSICFKIGTEMSSDIYKKTLFQPYSVHVLRNTSEIISTISTKVSSVTSNVIISIINIAMSIIMTLMIMIALILVNPTIAIFSFLGFGLIYVIIIVITKNYVRENSKKISIESTKVIKALQEGLGGIRDVLIDGLQMTYSKEYEKSDTPFRKAHANLIILGDSPRYLIEGLGMILISLLAFYLSNNSDTFLSTIPTLGAFALGAQRILPVLQQAYGSWTNMNGAMNNLSDTLELLNQQVANYANKTKKINFRNSINIQNVYFKYDKNEDWVIKDLNFSISKGETIGVIGSTGCGKSTLLDIIMGLLYPVNGKLIVDKTEINSKNYQNWVPNISHVPQSIFLSDTTISQNIALGIDESKINYNKLKISIEKAQLSDFIESLEFGYNTNVGERGVKLSGGQRQRIGIARAIYKEADLIIFDEATSALDSKTENKVMKSIEKLGDDLTIIIVAHRVSTLKSCDRIIELDNGQVKRICSYTQLTKN